MRRCYVVQIERTLVPFLYRLDWVDHVWKKHREYRWTAKGVIRRLKEIDARNKQSLN